MLKEKIKLKEKLKNMIKKINQLRKNYFNGTETISSEKEYGFNFKNSNYYITFICFFTLIIIPIVYSFIKKYAFHIDTEVLDPQKILLWGHLNWIINLLIPIMGMALAIAISWKVMIKNGGWAAYATLIFGFFAGLFSELILVRTGVINSEKNLANFFAITFLVQVLFQFLGSILVIISNKVLRKQFLATIKEAKLDLLTWVFIAFLFCQLLNWIFSTIKFSTFNIEKTNFLAQGISKNQERLNIMASTHLGFFALVLGSVFLAPINEEISYRFGIFSLSSNKWIGYFASLIYFPSIHIIGDGDWENFFGYLAPSIFFPLLFIFSRGNLTYTIGLHMLVNGFVTVRSLIG